MQTDTSEHGLDTALIQNGCPIAFASRTLTDIETQYANTKRECVSVCFNLQKFHTTYTATTSPSKITTGPWRWSSLSPSMPPHPSTVHATLPSEI